MAWRRVFTNLEQPKEPQSGKRADSSFPVQGALSRGSHSAQPDGSYLSSLTKGRTTHSLHRALCFTPPYAVFQTTPLLIPQCFIYSHLGNITAYAHLCVYLLPIRVSSFQGDTALLVSTQSCQSHRHLPPPPKHSGTSQIYSLLCRVFHLKVILTLTQGKNMLRPTSSSGPKDST